MTSVLRPEKLNESVPEPADRMASQDVRDAIQAAYPHEDGTMVAKMVSKRRGTSWYRVNWYRSSPDGMFINRSRFVAVSRTPEGVLEVEDQTICSPELSVKPSSN